MGFLRRICILWLLLFLSIDLFGGEIIERKDFSALFELSLSLQSRCPVGRTLVVTDIDNTLLAMSQDLGSEAWFQWQNKLLREGTRSSEDGDLVANDFDELLRIHKLLFSLSSMHATDFRNSSTILLLQSMGYPVIAMTSRSFDIQDVTFRELRRNHYSFLHSAIGPKGGYAGTYYPYQLGPVLRETPSGATHEAERFYLNDSQMKRWGLSQAKKVSYQNGVLFGDGQHKGVLLLSLLAKTEFHPCAVVFIDDSLKNIENMHDAFSTTGIPITLIRYSFMDDANQKFWNLDKTEVKNQWSRLRSTLDSIFSPSTTGDGHRSIE